MHNLPKPVIGNPTVREVPGQRRYTVELSEPLVVYFPIGREGGHLEITVPKGFRTDFASTPRILWPLLPPVGKYARAAIVHDYLYGQATAISRFLADALFRDIMRLLGVPLWKRLPMYYAVRFFGWLRWDGNKVSNPA